MWPTLTASINSPLIILTKPHRRENSLSDTGYTLNLKNYISYKRMGIHQVLQLYVAGTQRQATFKHAPLQENPIQNKPRKTQRAFPKGSSLFQFKSSTCWRLPWRRRWRCWWQFPVSLGQWPVDASAPGSLSRCPFIHVLFMPTVQCCHPDSVLLSLQQSKLQVRIGLTEKTIM